MKRGEDYLKQTFDWNYETQELTWYVNRWKELIKTIQEDAIRETVKECYISSEIRVLNNDTSEEGELYTYLEDGCFSYSIDKNSILSVADKLIKEL